MRVVICQKYTISCLELKQSLHVIIRKTVTLGDCMQYSTVLFCLHTVWGCLGWEWERKQTPPAAEGGWVIGELEWATQRLWQVESVFLEDSFFSESACICGNVNSDSDMRLVTSDSLWQLKWITHIPTQARFHHHSTPFHQTLTWFIAAPYCNLNQIWILKKNTW